MTSKLTYQQGFTLVPVIFLLTISLLIILTGSKELHQTVLMHQLKMRQDCVLLVKQLNKSGSLDFSYCPPCNLALGCLDEIGH
ncbi:hypothetical protein [Marinospirillum insulare]|uniref:Uncharacterized protein n=1 Tax=Marinospirillum insulare TaxID=217169 RepID=A0ABQ5ZYS4_9GAMM|nr:hypothetical protein [Marinospirillum insulare]GLR65134.1 hypothetical protein GCM10007878_25730 [Marinospirillum insulare]